MKIVIKKAFDGTQYIAFCENVPNCYVQSKAKEHLNGLIKRALYLYKNQCIKRGQDFPNEPDKPLISRKIRFDAISTAQIVKIFQRYNYHIEYEDEQSVILLNSDFPFNRVHLPQSNNLSPLIIQRIFGEDNTHYIYNKQMKLNTSVS